MPRKAAEEHGKSWRGWFREALRHPKEAGFWKAVGGIVATLAAATTVIAFAVDHFQSGGASCSKDGATLSSATVVPSTLDEYLQRSNASTEGLDLTTLQTPINEIAVSVSIDGYANKHLTLAWSMHEADGNRTVGPVSRPLTLIHPSRCSTRLRWTFWAARGNLPVVADIVVQQDQKDGGNVLGEIRTESFLGSTQT